MVQPPHLAIVGHYQFGILGDYLRRNGLMQVAACRGRCLFDDRDGRTLPRPFVSGTLVRIGRLDLSTPIPFAIVVTFS
jgi:hypothetical protein